MFKISLSQVTFVAATVLAVGSSVAGGLSQGLAGHRVAGATQVLTTTQTVDGSRFGQDKDDDRRLQEFVDAMTPVQKLHRTLYDEFSAGWVLDDAVNGMVSVGPHDPLSASVAELGIAESLRDATCRSDAVLVGEILSATSNPTEKGIYLFTDYDFRLDDVLKRPAGSEIVAGSSVIVTRAGGELTVEGRPLALWSPAFPRLEKRKYVFFAHFLQTTGTFQVRKPEDTLEIVNSELLRPLYSASDPAKVRRERMELAAFAASVRSASCRRPLQRQPQ